MGMVEKPGQDGGAAGTADPVAPQGKSAGFWRKTIAAAVKVRKQHETWWDANLKAYAPDVTQTPDAYSGEINTNRDFTIVERKKADLFYQRPDVTLQPTPLSEQAIPQLDPMGQPVLDPNTKQPITASAMPALQAHQEIVNEKLGPDGVDAVGMVHAALFDVLCTSGLGFTKMGYSSVTQDVEQQVAPAVIDPVTGQELQPAQTAMVPVPIHEECFWLHFSPKQAVIPADAKSTDWDRLPFLGYEFRLPLNETNRKKFRLPAEFTGSQLSPGEQAFDHGDGADEDGTGVIVGTEFWYKSALYRTDQVHPEHLTHAVLIDGIDDFVIHEDSPDQTIDDRGQLTPDSLIGFPIHPLNLRVMTDSAYPPSDCTMQRPLVNELNRFRTQMVEYRDAQTLRWMYNTDTLPSDAVEKMVRAPIGGMIGVPAEAFVGEGAIKELPHGSMARESFTSNDYIDADIARTSGIDASGSGVQSNVNQTATEAQIQQGNANARLDFERGRVLQWYCKGVSKFATLIARYLPVEQAAAIVGPQRAQGWDQWRKTVAGTLAFTAMPDSALRVDQAVDRRQIQELYTYVATDPFAAKGRAKLLEKVFRKFHIDPTGIVAPPDPPKPAPPGLALSFKGEDLIGPQAPIVIEILQQQGITISPANVQLSQGMLLQQEQLAAAAEAEKQAQTGNTAHGGKVAPMESLDKHNADSGLGMQGLGGVATAGAGGIQ